MSRPGHRPGTLERAVIAAVKAADWLEPADQALIWTGRAIAEEIDLIHARTTLDPEFPPADQARVVGELARSLLQVSREAAWTPASRHRIGITRPGPDLAAKITDLASFTRGADAG